MATLVRVGLRNETLILTWYQASLPPPSRQGPPAPPPASETPWGAAAGAMPSRPAPPPPPTYFGYFPSLQPIWAQTVASAAALQRPPVELRSQGTRALGALLHGGHANRPPGFPAPVGAAHANRPPAHLPPAGTVPAGAPLLVRAALQGGVPLPGAVPPIGALSSVAQEPPAPSAAADGALAAGHAAMDADAASIDAAPAVIGVDALAAAFGPTAMAVGATVARAARLGMPLDAAAASTPLQHVPDNFVFPAPPPQPTSDLAAALVIARPRLRRDGPTCVRLTSLGSASAMRPMP